MPITQQRMLDLVGEEEEVLRVHDSLVANIRTVLASPALRDSDKLTLIAAEIEAAASVPRTFVLVERRHFTSQARRNAKARDRAQRNRVAVALMTDENGGREGEKE